MESQYYKKVGGGTSKNTKISGGGANAALDRAQKHRTRGQIHTSPKGPTLKILKVNREVGKVNRVN